MSIPEPIIALREDAPTLERQLISWANVNSGSAHLAGLARMAEPLEAALRQLTPVVRRVPVAPDGRVALHAQCRPEAARRILCSGHYDTVYPADGPFQDCTRLDAERLQGPGVADMKGGLVVMLAVLRTLERLPDSHRLGWDVVLTPDEEIGSTASRPLLEQIAPRAQLGLVFEPARESGEVVLSRKGTGIFTIQCHGRSAHAGRAPEDGRNAILALAEYLLALQQIPQELPGVLLNVGRMQGGGAVNIVPAFAEAQINARCMATSDATAFVERLRALAERINARDGFRLEISGQFNRPPMMALPEVQPLLAGLHAAARDLGLAPVGAAHVSGGSDGNLLQAARLPCLDGLGPVGARLHSPEEWVRLPSLVERAQLTSLLLHRLIQGQLNWPTP